MDDDPEIYTHHATCGCTFDQEDAPATRCAEATRLAGRRRAAMDAGDAQGIRDADAAYHRHLAVALADAKR